jgi:EmrB/QacA subfamily drug resistance transporter
MTQTSDDRRYAWRVLSVTGIGVLLSGANTSTLDVALPTVSRHFNATASEASWMLLSYMLVNTGLIVAFGRLADIVGRRRLYLVGLAVFTVAGLACGFATNAVQLDAMRAVQAVGAASIVTNTTALLTDAFPPEILSLGLGLNVTIVSAAQVIGPLLGGLLATTLGWRAVFWFNVPTGAVGLVWAMISLRRTPRSDEPREPFDVVGAVLSFAVLGSLVLVLSEGGALGWTSTPVVAGAVVFAVTAPVFLLVQARRRYPLVDLRMFADRERSMAYLAAFLLSLARFAVVLLVSLYLQAADGVDPFQAGLRVVPVAIGMMFASPVAGALAHRYSARVLSTGGLALTGAGLAGLAAVLRPHLPYAVMALTLLVIGAGSGLFLTPNTSSIMASIPARRRGIANGIRSMMQNSGYVVSVALSLAIITSPLAASAKKAAYAGTLSSLPGGTLKDFTTGCRTALLVLAAMTIVGMVASLRRDPPPAGRGRTSHEAVPAVTE